MIWMICVPLAGNGCRVIEFLNIKSKPAKIFGELYDLAFLQRQANIEACCVSLVSSSGYPTSRMVNIKSMNDTILNFYTNYKSSKAKDINFSNKISCVFYWPSTRTQIRISGIISKISNDESDLHFSKRTKEKNAIAISSMQSKKISSFEEVVDNYTNALKSSNLSERPSYWGGYKILPNYFEFWEGHDSRLNKRTVYIKDVNDWQSFTLQP